MRTIRCSMLPAFGDCARRAIAKQYRREVEAAGFALTQTKPSIGAAVGTAVHAALSAARKGVEPMPMEAFHQEIARGVEWDDTTPALHGAEAQIGKMTAAALQVPTPTSPFTGIELPLRATVEDGWELTGTLDAITEAGHIDDLKTGALSRPYESQLGGYVLLATTNGRAATTCSTTFIRRVRVTKPQPPAVVEPINVTTAVKAAWYTIRQVRETMERFAATGDPWEIPFNNMSLMCSAKYCPAHGTRFCAMGRPARDKEMPVD